MLVIRLFGGLAIELEGREVAVPRRRHGGLLLAYLALFPGEHARADLAALLWPDVLDSSARTSLRSALHSIRRALGRDAARYLLASRDSLGLAHGDEVWVDALAFDQLIREGEPERALALAKAELLQGLEAEWVDAARQRYLALADQTLSALAGEAQRAGDLEAALRHARGRVALDPLAEPANRELMRLLSEQGDRASALSVYARLCERYRRELRITPSHETRALAERVRTSGRSATVGREDHARLPPLPAVVAARRFAPLLARDEDM